ncbi:MAG: enoyl-CoA hydratase/isomerase family protein [Rhodospirillales bacterium]|nr:enoyl-CoA hydratase/isomerase family protein [Rhodospirillales bacterium]
MSAKDLVRLERDGAIGVIVVDNPPVNALSAGVPEGIIAALAQGNADPAITALVLIGAGRSFIAGADIRRFGTGSARLPIGSRTYDRLDLSAKPVVAAIHGFALGGGLENAMACHYRIAVADAKLGLPEVRIGILPGGGGTQRLPRLAGPRAALDMIVSGRHIGTDEAQRLGILDRVVPAGTDLRAAAIGFAHEIAARRPLPRVRDLSDKLRAEGDPALFAAARAQHARRARFEPAVENCIRAVEAACSLPFDQGMLAEDALFNELENTPQARALRYAFFAEREVGKIPGLPKDTATPPITRAAVIGAGTMGSGIAMCFADAGIPVQVLEQSAEALARGMDRIRATYAASVKRGSLSEAEMAARLSRIAPASDYPAIAEADAVIEAVFEEMDAKLPIFARLDAVMKPGALLLTNTSALDVDRIAAATGRPQDVAGAHFFSPANVMKLLEVVRGAATAPQTLARVLAMGRMLGKLAVVAGNTDGFVANRSRLPFNTEMVILLEEGALPAQVDAVMKDFGYPMGPFAVGDLAGLDVSAAGRRRRAAAGDPNYRALPIADRLVAMGRLGQKTGAGWYRYDKGDRTPHPDPAVAAIIAEEVARLGTAPRALSDQEILHRLLFASVNEACRIIEGGFAYRAVDVDVMWLHGFGFPRHRGGLMHWADTIGAGAILAQMRAWQQSFGPRWAPAPLLVRIAEAGGKLVEAKAPGI